MKKILLMCVTMLVALPQAFAGKPLSIKDITGNVFSAKTISGINPLKGTSEFAQISSDEKKIVKYSFKTGRKTGVLFDLSDTKGTILREFDDYEISDDGQFILIQTNTKRVYRRSFKADFYLYNVKDKALKILSTGGAQQIPTFSPDCKHIAFVRDNNIFITNGTSEKQITTDGQFNKVINGLPDWVNEEEFGFNNALAWSTDGKTLSWIRYDESKVKTYSLQMFRGAKPTKKEYEVYPGEYAYKYPKAGEDNSKVSVWSYQLDNDKILQYQLPLAADGYIPRIKTSTKDNQVIVYTMNRHQDELNLYSANPLTGDCKLLIKENVPKYVKEEAVEAIAIMKNSILLPSDRDGHMHLYLYTLDGKLIRQIEKGDYDVIRVYGYDEKTGKTYFQAAAKTPMQREIYVADKRGNVSCLSDRNGWNNAVFSGDYNYFLNTWSDRNHPYVFTIYDNMGKAVREVLNNNKLMADLEKFEIPKKEFFKFTTSEGIELNGWIMKPADFDASKKYPVIFYQYSGPGSQQVVDSWAIGSMRNGGVFDAYLTQKGFIVACVDGRGTGARGADFEKSIYLRLGDLESKDQVEAALWMGKQSYVDASRIGIWGWSFGGFNTLMSMSEGRKVFKAGVSIAPPTNWRYYDTVYTERYMRTPQENAAGYAINPIERAGKLSGKLLICHGIADDNVHIQNTYEYSEALIQADKDFKENFYTNRNHGIFGGNTRNHLLRQVSDWFIEHL